MRACPPRSTDNQTSLNRIMLRFRPIAPKPAGEEVGSGAAEQNRRDLTGKRVKRKYVRIRARQSKRCPKSKGLEGGNLPSPPERSGVDDAPPPEERAVTLQLLGEREICEIRVPESKEMMLRDQDRCSTATAADLSGYGSVMVTWIVMEGVTDRFAGIGLGSSDEEKMYNLERETCPGFISDDRNNVIWVNPAYKKMVAEDDAAADKGFLVRLVVKEQLPQFCPSFACRVRVTQQNAQGQKWNKIVPCDVWRMEFAGFAWKLDVNTALSLGF